MTMTPQTFSTGLVTTQRTPKLTWAGEREHRFCECSECHGQGGWNGREEWFPCEAEGCVEGWIRQDSPNYTHLAPTHRTINLRKFITEITAKVRQETLVKREQWHEFEIEYQMSRINHS
jgi:hypothetical protein